MSMRITTAATSVSSVSVIVHAIALWENELMRRYTKLPIEGMTL